MQDNRCPNCENDISTTVTSTLISMLLDGERRSCGVSCPHCGEDLTVTAQISTSLSREVATSER